MEPAPLLEARAIQKRFGRVIALRDGTIVADGSPGNVLTPEHIYDVFEITAAVFKRPDDRGNYIIPTA